MSRYLAFRAQLSNELRTESLFGVDHLVVPVVALVEGVIQGMASPTPELALAEEFGKVPEGWNGRPLVMNHPVLNNQPVSANAPTVLETFAFGQLFNTTVEDGKLKTEAWINLDRVNALGGEVASTVERIQKGTTVEVSTGLFTGVEQVQGKFNNKSYDAIWRNIVPDHLAFLSEGVKGACSIEDGCGTPRVNSETHWQEYKMSTTDGDCGCGCNGTGTCKDSHVHTNATEPTTEPTEPSFDIGRLLSNAAPAGMFSKDIRALLAMAIEKTYGYAYVIGFTADHVIFELYDANEGRYLYARQSYTITDNKVVSLGDDKENVLLLTEIVPESGTQAGQPKLFQAKGNSEMAGENEPTTPTNPTTPAATTEAPAVPVTNAAPAPVAPRTLAQYLEEMPEEMRETISASMKLHSEQKQDLIKALKETGRCQFSDKQLEGFNLETLKQLTTLASVPTYEGRATPVEQDVTLNANAAPAAPNPFERKTA